MIKIILNGCNGRMGRTVTEICSSSDEYEIVAGLDINDFLPNEYPVYINNNECYEKADVILDFSHPSVLKSVTDYATKRNLPLVIATTGLSREQKNFLHDASKKIPVFFSVNMCMGINLLIDLAKIAAKTLSPSSDIEIVEMHHNQKTDAPSGTALLIADAVSEEVDYQARYVYDRHLSRKRRMRNEIGIHSIRGGTVSGEHSVFFAGSSEVLEIKHSAQNRDVFVYGALNAVKFIKEQEPGLYSMEDLLKTLY